MEKVIYKICPRDVWNIAQEKGCFEGYGIDKADGYIHFSTSSQVEETLRLHFNNIDNLVILSINISNLKITWEKSRGGQLFPHLYNSLDILNVQQVFYLKKNNCGNFIIPKKILNAK